MEKPTRGNLFDDDSDEAEGPPVAQAPPTEAPPAEAIVAPKEESDEEYVP